MKNLLGCLFLTSICFLPYVHPSATGDYWVSIQHSKTPVQVAGQADQKQEAKKEEQKNMEPLVTGDLSSVLTRALSSDSAGKGSTANAAALAVLAKNQVRFTKSAYASGAQGNTLYLGAENLGVIKDLVGNITKSFVLGTDKKNFALSSAVLGFNSSGAFAPMIQSLAPDKVTLNGEKDQPNPLVQDKPNAPNGTNITNLTLLGHTLPTLTASVVNATMNKMIETEATKVFVVTDPVNGTALLQNNNTIKDSNGDDIEKSIVAISASTQEIFAAVSAKDQTFEEKSPAGDNRGIAVLRRAVDDLTVLNDKAAKIDVKAYNVGTPVEANKVQFAFYDDTDKMNNPIDNAKLGNTAAMFWDDTFQRLFIGLEAKRDDINKAGGVLNLAVARLEKKDAASATADVLTISPIVKAPTKNLFYDGANAKTINVIDKVVGFYFDSVSDTAAGTIDTATEASLATDIIRSMHTTTGKDYLIIAGRFDDGTGPMREIYALPLQSTGTLSKKDFSGAPTAMDEMPGKDEDAVRVGRRTFENAVKITDLFVRGDSVYLCLAGKDGAPALFDEVGIFQSTALFDENGIINAWTPFTRVMGSVERVFGAGLDNRTGEYLFVAETNEDDGKKPFFDPTKPAIFADNISSVRLSGWGKTDTVNDLSLELEKLFSQSQGGVHQLITFDEKTPGFNADHLSVMLALGLDRIALIQTGKINTLFVSETDFITTGPTQNIFPFMGGALSDVGPLCTADFARSVDANEGWLFIGGYDGVAVLRKPANGAGFDSSAPLGALTAADFPGTGYSFKKLTRLSNADSKLDHVRKITCLNQVLYILTENNLYAVAFAANKFQDDPGSAALGEIAIDLMGVPNNASLLDFIVLAGKYGENTFKALLATTKGLFTITHNGARYFTQEVKVGGKSLDSVIQMQYLSSTKGAPSTFGNLYILAADIAKNPTETKVYRFAVNAGTVLPIPSNNITPAGLVASFGEFRSNFFADGSTILHTRGRHFGDTNYLAAVPTTDFKSSIPLTPRLALTTDNTSIGAVVRDSASGALYVPGDWGVRANL